MKKTALLFVALLLLTNCASIDMRQAINGQWAVDYEATRALNPYLRNHQHLRDMAGSMILTIDTHEQIFTYAFVDDGSLALTSPYSVIAESDGQLIIKPVGRHGPIDLTIRFTLKDGLLTCIVPESNGRDDLVFHRVRK